LLQDDEAVAIRQPEIEEHEIDVRAALRDGFLRRARLDDRVPIAGQSLCQRPANQLLIVNDQDGGRHNGDYKKVRSTK
jgi:hypothetical protein